VTAPRELAEAVARLTEDLRPSEVDGPRAALTVLKADLRLVLAALAEARQHEDSFKFRCEALDGCIKLVDEACDSAGIPRNNHGILTWWYRVRLLADALAASGAVHNEINELHDAALQRLAAAQAEAAKLRPVVEAAWARAEHLRLTFSGHDTRRSEQMVRDSRDTDQAIMDAVAALAAPPSTAATLREWMEKAAARAIRQACPHDTKPEAWAVAIVDSLLGSTAATPEETP
jgi:hypothetical protein